MSNKTQLQTNNTNLDALITRVNAAKDVAASLPEAGGESDGNVETCTITFTVSIPGNATICYYTDGNTLELKTTNTNNTTIIIPMNSIVVMTGWNAMVSANGLYSEIFYDMEYAAYYISGNCSFSYNSEPAR